MDEMRELIDERTVELIMRVIAIGLPLAGLAIGCIVGLVKRPVLKRTLQGFGIGCFGLLNYGMWRLYSYLVRYDPATGYCGLHKVSVLLLNVVIFAALGALIGIVWGLWSRKTASTRAGGAKNAENA